MKTSIFQSFRIQKYTTKTKKMENYYREREAQIAKVNVAMYNNLFFMQKNIIEDWVKSGKVGPEKTEFEIIKDLHVVIDLFVEYLQKELPEYEFKRKSELDRDLGTILVSQKYSSVEEYIACCFRAKTLVIRHHFRSKFTNKEIENYMNQLFESMEPVKTDIDSKSEIAKNQYFTIHRVKHHITNMYFEWAWNITYHSNINIAVERSLRQKSETPEKNENSKDCQQSNLDNVFELVGSMNE